MSKLNLSSPWQTFYNEMMAMFKEDENVNVVIKDGENEKVVYLYVTGQDKAAALEKILVDRVEFGGVEVNVVVKPSNAEPTIDQLYDMAFAGNPAYSFSKTLTGIFTNPLHFIVFKNKVVQFWNDDIGDIYGNTSTLYQEIAKDIFKQEGGEMYCTDWPDNLCVGKREDNQVAKKLDDELPWSE